MIKATFFNGKTSKAISAEVLILGSYLVIKEMDTKSEINLELAKLEVTHQEKMVVFSTDDFEIHIAKNDYHLLNYKTGFLGKDLAPIKQGLMIALGFCLCLYLFYSPLMKAAVFLIPDAYFDSIAKKLMEQYRPRHCLNKEQEKILGEVFARLGKNFSNYKVYIIKSNTVNAFAMPGNLVVIQDQLLKNSPSAEALAGIISHEIAHIDGEHLKIGLIKHDLIDTLSAFLMNENVATTVIKHITSGLFTQEEERKADFLAASELKNQHISPKGMVLFFQQMQKKEPGVLKFLSFTHPSYPERIKVFSEVYDSYPVLSESSWKTLKSGCK